MTFLRQGFGGRASGKRKSRGNREGSVELQSKWDEIESMELQNG